MTAPPFSRRAKAAVARCGIALLFLGSTVVDAAALDAVPSRDVAARVDGQPVLLRDVDAPSREKVERLRAELVEVFNDALDRVIDRALVRQSGARHDTLPTPVPVSDEAVRAYRNAHPEDFAHPSAPGEGDPAVQGAAIRRHLEQQAREAAEGAARRRRREAHAVERLAPPTAELDRPLAAQRVIARVDGRPLTADAVEQTAALSLYRLRGELFRERRRNLDVLIDDLLLRREASRRGISPAALAAELEAPGSVSDAELDAFVESERRQGRAISDPERARPYLAFQQAHARRRTLLDTLRSGARIAILLSEPRAPRLAMEEAGAPALGPPRGRRIIAYTNYRCAPCRATHRELDRLRSVDPTVRVAFRDFIPVYDPVAEDAARLARCAASLQAFAAMREELLAREPPPFGTPWYGKEELAALAGRLAVDPRRLTRCLVATATPAAIEGDTTAARELGFDEAPAFVADGHPLSGMQSADGFARALRALRHPRTTPAAQHHAD